MRLCRHGFFGNCSIPRGIRNDSLNPSVSQSINSDLQTMDIQISVDLIDVFKDISKENSAARRETEAILAMAISPMSYVRCPMS